MNDRSPRASLLAALSLFALVSACRADGTDGSGGEGGGDACRCAPANGIGRCEAGACVIACSKGFADCDGDAMNGCEASLADDALHCGRCGLACNYANALGVCADDACGMGSCVDGFADCDDDPANGCEVDTRSAPHDCGSCGNDCAMAACVGSVCAAPPEEVYRGFIHDFIVDGDSLVITGGTPRIDEGRVLTVPARGGAETVLVEHQYKPWSLVKDAGGIYWGNIGSGVGDGGIMARPAGAPAPVPLVEGLAWTGRLATDASRVFFVADRSGEGIAVRQVAKQGGAETILIPSAPGAMFEAIQVEAPWVYFATSASTASFARVPIGGGAIETLRDAGHEGAASLVLDGDFIYLSESGSSDETVPGHLMRMAKDGSRPTVLAEPLPNPWLVAVDGGDAYVVTQRYVPAEITMLLVPGDGSGPVVVASLVGPTRTVHVAGGYVYFESGGAIYRTPR